MQITTIGLDLAKHVFQVHGVDANDAVVEKRRLRRGQVLSYFAKLAPCRVGLEACATAHFWARELRRLGHEVRLIPPQYVKAYLKRGKNAAADAADRKHAVHTINFSLASRGPSTHGSSRRPTAPPHALAGLRRDRQCRAAWARSLDRSRA
jgi:transposase